MADFDVMFSMHPAVRVHPPLSPNPSPPPARVRSWTDETVRAVLASGGVLNSLAQPLPRRLAVTGRPKRRESGYEGLGAWEHARFGLEHVEADLHALAGVFRLLSDDLESAQGGRWPPYLPKVVTFMRELATDLTESLDRIHAQPLGAAAQGNIDSHLLDLALLQSGGEAGLGDVGIDLALSSDAIAIQVDPQRLETAFRDHAAEASQTFRQAADDLDLIVADLEADTRSLPEADQ